jgi:predicted transcriptional regulator
MAAGNGSAPLIRALKDRYPDMTDARIAKRVGCSQQNVSQVLDRYLGARSLEDLRQFQENRADIFDSLTMRAIGSITEAKLAKASAPALMMVAGTAHDKSQVLRGQATGINVSVLLDVAKAIRDQRDNPQQVRVVTPTEQ